MAAELDSSRYGCLDFPQVVQILIHNFNRPIVLLDDYRYHTFIYIIYIYHIIVMYIINSNRIVRIKSRFLNELELDW